MTDRSFAANASASVAAKTMVAHAAGTHLAKGCHLGAEQDMAAVSTTYICSTSTSCDIAIAAFFFVLLRLALPKRPCSTVFDGPPLVSVGPPSQATA